MIKWFLYIVLVLIFAPRLSFAKSVVATHNNTFVNYHIPPAAGFTLQQRDTSVLKASKQRPTEEEKKKIKEIAKAKKLPKPVKVEEVDAAKQKPKPKRQRRPDGLERPPEIPRRNNN